MRRKARISFTSVEIAFSICRPAKRTNRMCYGKFARTVWLNCYTYSLVLKEQEIKTTAVACAHRTYTPRHCLWSKEVADVIKLRH